MPQYLKIITFRNKMLFWLASVICLVFVENGVFAVFESERSDSVSDSEEMNETLAALEKNGITGAMLDKFENANDESEKITSSFIAKQLKTLSVNKPLTDEERKELAKSMLEGVRMWFVALEVGLPTMSKYIDLANKYKSSNLELSLHINYFLQTTSSVNNKMHNKIVDTMREAGVKNAEVADAVQPEILGYAKSNCELAQELIELILTDGENNEQSE